MPKTKPNEPVEIRPVPPSVVQVFETVAAPLVVPAPPEPEVLKDVHKPEEHEEKDGV